MRRFAETAERIAATTKKLEKTALLAEYLTAVPVEEAAVAAIFFSGRPFPVWEETTLQVGGSMLWRAVAELAGRSEPELAESYRAHGDLGAVAADLLSRSEQVAGRRPRTPVETQQMFREIAAARGTAAKAGLVRSLLGAASPLEAKYLVKVMTGDLRIGLKESLVEEAIAKAYGGGLPLVQRANMLLGDIGETLKLAAQSRLEQARMRLFHPIGFMLASPAQSAEEALVYFENAWVEDKYDGIRSQAHCSGRIVRLFSRTRDEITESFPELRQALGGLAKDVILDGEIVAWSYLADDPLAGTSGRALPFSALQQRLGRKQVSEELMRQVPVAYLAFDVLYAAGELVIDRPLVERARLLNQLLSEKERTESGAAARLTASHFDGSQEKLAFDEAAARRQEPVAVLVIRAPVFHGSTPDELKQLFDAAQARNNEGLMIKDPQSPYTPGRRGKSWLKLKRELATLDVVVTAVEYGHGRRIGVLSDYTFAVRDGDQLVNIGKAYSGLTDREIADMTRWFLEHTLEDQGFRRIVKPEVVLEVAFNNIMKSTRHNSGYALRFPRIVRLRSDKLPQEADTVERVREIYARQGA
ncbi:MAG: ATP-dependent DNA ligase [Acidobacteria bacterium]|nr:ATP-dependent DNA ligase [Acidobacteriota bacterium]